MSREIEEIENILTHYTNKSQLTLVSDLFNHKCMVCGKSTDSTQQIISFDEIINKYVELHKVDLLKADPYLVAYHIIKYDPIYSNAKHLVSICDECKQIYLSKDRKDLNLTNIDYSLANKSYSLFVSGCSAQPKCTGCFNPENWQYGLGRDWRYYIPKIRKDLANDHLIDKIILVGGDPVDQDEYKVYQLIQYLKQYKKPIFLFTHHDLAEIPKLLLDSVEYVKCGRFIPELCCENNVQYGLKLATSNQKIYQKGLDY